MVAAFAKKLARISLTAPASALTITIPFIYNLINRHPNCKILIHRETPEGKQGQIYTQSISYLGDKSTHGLYPTRGTNLHSVY